MIIVCTDYCNSRKNSEKSRLRWLQLKKRLEIVVCDSLKRKTLKKSRWQLLLTNYTQKSNFKYFTLRPGLGCTLGNLLVLWPYFVVYSLSCPNTDAVLLVKWPQPFPGDMKKASKATTLYPHFEILKGWWPTEQEFISSPGARLGRWPGGVSDHN